MLYTWVTEVVIAQKCFKYQISCAGPYILVEKLDENMSVFFGVCVCCCYCCYLFQKKTHL